MNRNTSLIKKFRSRTHLIQAVLRYRGCKIDPTCARLKSRVCLKDVLQFLICLLEEMTLSIKGMNKFKSIIPKNLKIEQPLPFIKLRQPRCQVAQIARARSVLPLAPRLTEYKFSPKNLTNK